MSPAPAGNGTGGGGGWRLAFAYDPAADRLALSVSTGGRGPAVALALTRRLTARLIDGFAGLLERTSPAAARAPADLREDIVLLEHQTALSAPAGASGGDADPDGRAGAGEQAGERPEAGPAREPARESAGGPAGGPALDPRAIAGLPLLEAIDVAVGRADFALTLKAGGAAAARFRCTRAELHRILESLSRQSERAGWNIAVASGWLGRRAEAGEGASVTLN